MASDREELEALRRFAELEARASGATPAGGPATRPGRSGPTVDTPTVPSVATGQPTAVDESLVNLGVIPPTRQNITPKLSETLRAMGEELDPVSKLGSGVVQGFERGGRALGLPHAIQALTGKPMDTEGEAFKGLAEGTGALGTVGDIAGTGALTVPVVRAIQAAGAKMLPQSVLNWANKSRYVAPALETAGVTGATAGIMSPGDIEERAKQAVIGGVTAIPLNAAVRFAASPAKMSETGQVLRAATGETPPLHIGAESKLLQDLGDLTRGIPLYGHRLQAGEQRVWDKGVLQLWQHATPPGKPNLLSSIPGSNVTRGKLLEDLKDQFDDAYLKLLKGKNIAVKSGDRFSVTRMIDKELVPEDAARVHHLLDKYFPKNTSNIGGETWKELQAKIRFEASKYSGSPDPAQQTIGETLSKVDNFLVKLRNRSLPTSVTDNLDATDRAYSVRRLLETAMGQTDAEKGLTPKMLSRALKARTSDAALARGHGVGQPLIDPLSASLGDMDDRNITSALWGLRRLAAPTLVAGAAGGLPGLAVPAAYGVSMNWLGAGKRGSKVMFGETETQKRVAKFLKDHPETIPTVVSTLGQD